MGRNLTEKQIKDIEEKIGYTFKNKDLLSSAFRRKSFTQELKDESNIPNNETLEFYGDSAINLIVVKALAHIASKSFESNVMPKRNEEALTHFVSNYTDKAMLASIIEPTGLADYLIMGKGDIQNNVNREESVREDLFESIVGAMWFDNNLDIDAIYDYVARMLDLRTDKEEFYVKNAFVQLKEYVDKEPDIRFYKENGIFYLWYKEDLLDFEPIGFFRGENDGRYQTMINAANYFINVLKRHNLWKTKTISIEGLTVENAINRLNELFDQKYIDEPVQYPESNQFLDRTTNLWHVDCIFKNLIHGADAREKKEAKKLSAYDMYLDIAKKY